MVSAVIDIGTNTFHLLIIDGSGNESTILHKEKVAVRLGKDGISQGYINSDAIDRAITTLSKFKSTIADHNPDQLTVTATSAVRNAHNGDDFVKKVHNELELDIQVLSGEQEAFYIYKGVTEFFDLGNHPVLIMDIGGGSIEFVIATQSDVLWMKSFELGGQRLMDKFHNHDPISESEVIELKEFLNDSLKEVIRVSKSNKVQMLIGSSGTFDTLQDISSQCYDQIDNGEHSLSIRTFDVILNDLIIKNREKRLKIPGMIPMRVDMIVVASILTDFIIKKVGINQIKISNYALKEGILFHAPSDIKTPFSGV